MANLSLIKKVVITEKATRLNEMGKYAFIVADSANKTEVKKAVHELYKVDVVDVAIMNRKPKSKRFRNIVNKRSGYKKAIVTLKKGQKIDIA